MSDDAKGPGKLEGLLTDYLIELAQLDEHNSITVERLYDALLSALREADRRSDSATTLPTEPSEAAFGAAIKVFTDERVSGFGMTLVRPALRAAYAVDRGSPPPAPSGEPSTMTPQAYYDAPMDLRLVVLSIAEALTEGRDVEASLAVGQRTLLSELERVVRRASRNAIDGKVPRCPKCGTAKLLCPDGHVWNIEPSKELAAPSGEPPHQCGVTFCESTFRSEENGVCPAHGGDACLVTKWANPVGGPAGEPSVAPNREEGT